MEEKNKEKNSEPFPVGAIVSVITIITAFHYYFSYRWLSSLIKQWGLSRYSILTFEDIIFPTIRFNRPLFVLMLLGFLGIFIIEFSNLNRKDLLPKWDELKKIPKNNITKGVVIIALILMLILFFILIQSFFESKTGILWAFYALVILLGIPILYCCFERKRNLILLLQIVCMFFWCDCFIGAIFPIETKDIFKTTAMTFDYKNETINAKDSLSLLFHGAKYLVFTDCDSKFHLFESNQVGKIIIEP